MIFSFAAFTSRNETKVRPSAPTTCMNYDRLVDISLDKLSDLQAMGKFRCERKTIMVLDVLHWALHSKYLEECGQKNLSDLVYYFEDQIYKSIERQCIDRLPRLWIDLPGGLMKAREIPAKDVKIRIKASFIRRNNK